MNRMLKSAVLFLTIVTASPLSAQVIDDGWTWSINGGASWRLEGRTSLAVELFYSPLSVVRPPSTSSENDPLLNLRTMLRFEL